MEIKENTIYNCDCMELMQEMVAQGIKANLLLTDIPYGEVNREDNGLRTLTKENADVVKFDLTEFLELVDKCITDNFIIWCGTEQVSEIRKFFAEKDYTTRLIIWQKNNPSPMNGQYTYLSGIECGIYAKKPNGTFNAFCKNTVFKHNSGEKDIHPTQKPLSLWYELLSDLSNEGDLVLDTCMGSFTTAIACHKMGRKYIGAELDPTYYELGLQRLNQVKSQISMFD